MKRNREDAGLDGRCAGLFQPKSEGGLVLREAGMFVEFGSCRSEDHIESCRSLLRVQLGRPLALAHRRRNPLHVAPNRPCLPGLRRAWELIQLGECRPAAGGSTARRQA